MADSQNALLAKLTATDLELLSLEPVELVRGQRLERCGRRTEHVYFPNRGLAFVVSPGPVEVGMIGREGMTGLATVMGAEHASYDTLMQIAGTGSRTRADTVREALHASQSFRRVALDYGQAFLAHVAAGSAANARNKLEERLARWLAVAQDRVNTDELPLTHELIAAMLGVRRAGVTVSLRSLQQQGFLKCHRGTIEITDREGLVSASHGAYARADETMRPRCQ